MTSQQSLQHTTEKCKFCGANLKPRTLECLGQAITIGTVPCSCEKARKVRAQEFIYEQECLNAKQAKKQAAARLRAGIPRRYINAKHPQAKECAQAVQAGRTLFITGNVGVGKTHLACAICTKLQEQTTLTFRMNTAVGLLRLFEDAMRQNKSETELLKTLVQPDVLVIDDLGKERITNWTYERIFDLLDMRYNDLKPIVITSNFTLSQLAGRLVEGGCNKQNAQAMISRLKQTSESVTLAGKDWRLV